MSATSRGMNYGARLSGVILAVGFLSAAVLYLLILGRPGSPLGGLFADPFPSSRVGAPIAADSTIQGESGAGVAHSAGGTDPSPGTVDQPSTLASPDTGGAFVASPPTVPAADPRERARRAVVARDWPRALELYDSLIGETPADRTLAIERALVISWSGDFATAAAELRRAEPSPSDEPELVLVLVRNLLWAGSVAAADDVLQPLAALRPHDVEIDSLRSGIRRSVDPPVDLAILWLDRRDSPSDRLNLARALARAGRPAESLDHYRRALIGLSPADSLALEMAAAAEGADSLTVAGSVLASYIEAAPHDAATRLRLARIYRWTGQSEDARREYKSVIQVTGRFDARLELAQLDAWSGRPDSARPALEDLLLENPRQAAVLKLLGDLARWEGDLEVAESHYRAAFAADPAHPGVAESIAEVERALASRPALPGQERWAATMDGFNDSDGFLWLTTRAARSWHSGGSRLDLAVHQDLWDAARPPSAAAIGPGHGVEIIGETPLTGSALVRMGAGVRSYGSGFDFASWVLELSHPDVYGAFVTIGQRREPTFRRAATAAALQAQVTSDITRLTAGRSIGHWHAWSQVEVEHLNSTLGGTWRRSGSAALRRELGNGWAAFGSAGSLATSGPSPVLAEWGPLYWAPSSFSTIAAGGEFSSRITPAWSIRMRLAPGYAWIDERAVGERRYVSDRAATLSSGFEAAYLRGRWRTVLAGDSDAAHQGYRAGALRLGIHYSPPRP